MKKAVLVFIVLAMSFCLFACKTSDGEREGKLTQFSVSGVFIDSHEGTLQMGETQNGLWTFSVKDDDKNVIDTLNRSVGKHIKVRYEKRINELGNIGYSTRFFVKSVEVY